MARYVDYSYIDTDVWNTVTRGPGGRIIDLVAIGGKPAYIWCHVAIFASGLFFYACTVQSNLRLGSSGTGAVTGLDRKYGRKEILSRLVLTTVPI